MVSATPDPSLWYDGFEVPWKRMPGKLLYVLSKGRRPNKSLMRIFVKIVCEEIRKFDLYPSKKILDVIARNIFELCPQSLCDDPCMDILKFTYNDLLTQLENRLLKYFDMRVHLTDIKNEIGNSFNQLHQYENSNRINLISQSNIYNTSEHHQSIECNEENCDNMDFVEIELNINVPDKPVMLNSKVKAVYREFGVLNPIVEISNHSVLDSGPRSLFLFAKWYKEFHIPWHKMPTELMKAFHERQLLNSTMRNDMAKVISNEIRTITKHPDRKSITYVAKRTYEAYPESLCDPFCVGKRVTKKCYILLVKELIKQIRILNRKENMRPKRSKYINHHCCDNWQPKKLPKNETKKSQLQKKQELKVISICSDTLDDKIAQLLKDTFYSQRRDIIISKSIETVIREWPLLFTTIGQLNHFKTLVGFDCLKKFHDSLLTKANFVFYYFMYISMNGCRTLKLFFEELEQTKDLDRGESSTILIFLIMAYFQEDRENLFLTRSDHKNHHTLVIPVNFSGRFRSLASFSEYLKGNADKYLEKIKVAVSENMTNLPKTPCLIMCGESSFHSSNFMLCIEGKVVNRRISDFTTGLIMLFTSYFVFNICYPVGAKATLQFIQMYLFDLHSNQNTSNRVISLIKSLEKYGEQDKVQ